jgi:hypothetical protein
MSAKGILIAMIAGSAAVVGYAVLRPDPDPAPPPTAQTAPEQPWLSREATEQIVGKDGVLGPLFAGVRPGGPAPSDETRTRSTSFARANHATIDIASADGAVTTIRFSVTYGGCCGYEGADKLAAWLGRPVASQCANGEQYPDCDTKRAAVDWATPHDGVIMRAAVRVNRVDVRWDKELTASELFERAERLVGAEVEPLRAAEPDRWDALEGGKHYRVELPYTFTRGDMPSVFPSIGLRDDLGLMAAVEHGRISHVSFTLRTIDEDKRKEYGEMLTARWGPPKIDPKEPGTWTWTSGDVEIIAQLAEMATLVELSPRPSHR